MFFSVLQQRVLGFIWLTALAISIAVVVSGIWLFEVASAQSLTLTSGPFVQVADEKAGPYRLIVHQSPERVILGTLSVAVQVHDAETDASIADAHVLVYGTPSEQGSRQRAPALNSPDDREYYVGRIEVEESGVWALDVVVDHPEFGSATLTLATEVFERSRGGDNLLFGTVLWVLVSLAFAGVVWHLIRKSRKMRAQLRQVDSTASE